MGSSANYLRGAKIVLHFKSEDITMGLPEIHRCAKCKSGAEVREVDDHWYVRCGRMAEDLYVVCWVGPLCDTPTAAADAWNRVMPGEKGGDD